MKKKAITLIAGLVLVAGCGTGNTGQAEPEPVSTETEIEPVEATATDAEPVEEPEPAVTGATVEQWASLVAEGANKVRAPYESWNDTDNDCLPGDTDITCMMIMLTMQYSADAFALSLEAGAKPDAPGFIGTPPVEIHSLVADTHEAAVLATTTAEAAHDSCSEQGEDCLGLAFEADYSYGKLVDKLDAWQPYGVS